MSLEPQLTRFLEGAAFVPGDRVSEAKGDPIDSAVLFPAAAARLARPDTGFRSFGLLYVSRQECLLHPVKLLFAVSTPAGSTVYHSPLEGLMAIGRDEM